MTNKIIIALLLLIGFSCNKATQQENQDTNRDSTSTVAESADTTPLAERTIDQSIRTQATILSVREELIMPDDYLTTVMTVKTASNDTLVFVDMFDFEALVNQEITIEYRLTSGSKMIVCFDCTSYSEEIQLFDITSFPSDIEFETLKFETYTEDPYIDAASTLSMVKEDGSTEVFYIYDNQMIADSSKMASAFYSYGIVTKLFPELENREELEDLIK